MKPRPKKSAAAREHERMLQKMRRAYLDKIIEKLQSKQLDDADQLMVLQTLKDVRDGYDARAYFGIKAKSGPHPQSEGPHKWATLYFLKLRALEPNTLEKKHRGIVTDATGLSDSRLRGIVKKYRAELAPVLALPTMTLENIRSMVVLASTASS
jgi:hypothetical protein